MFRSQSRSQLRTLSAIALLLLLGGTVAHAAAAPGDRNFDARAQLDLKAPARTPAQLEAVAALRASLPAAAVTFDPATGATRTLSTRVGYLTEEHPGAEPRAVALDFVRGHADLLGLTTTDLASYEVTDNVRSAATGATHLYLRQTHAGLPVYNGLLQINVNRDGRVISVNNAFLPGLAAAVNSTEPALDATEARRRAAEHLGLGPALSGGASSEGEARLMWLPIRRGEARLVWNFQLATPDGQHHYDFTVDAATGQVWTRFDWVADDAYRVYAQPAESPNHVPPPLPLPPADGRTLVTDPADATASPFAWHDTNGAAGAEFTNPRGNNVHAYEDSDANNAPPAVEPDCGSPILCDFPIDLTQPPSAYRPAAVANLFYWNNVIHDVQYQYGFTEAAGNFQVNNYGRGGAGGDDVRAEAQDGGGNCNANFLTPPDGSRPRMQMYTCSNSSPAQDGDLDSGVIVHEYGHGISNRQVGGPGNVSCLNNTQQAGEGWSDWLALAYTAQAGDAGTDARGIGTYLFGQPANGPGIRPAPYSTDFGVNNYTYSDISGVSIPHGIGFVWATILWEGYWELVDFHGFDPDLYNASGGAGNQRMMLYVNEGLQNTSCSPTFLDARDGVLQAAADNFGGEDVCRLWAAFARRGLGTDASTPGPSSNIGVDGFSVPPECESGCGDGICQAGEDCFNCPQDCEITTSGAVCGNGICEAGNGEDCVSCAADCAGKQNGNPASRYCCGDGDGQNPVPCSDSRCTSGGSACTDIPVSPGTFCCGDGICDPAGESCGNCALDCTEPVELCADGVDNDCDGDADCSDSDCLFDPACVCTLGQPGDPCSANSQCCSGRCKGNGTCK